MAVVDVEPSGTRQRLIDVAVDLFTRHSYAGTSLQMIADELGFTKAAIYHHFRTREQLLRAVLEPMFAQLRVIVDAAEAQRTPRARAERMLSGYVDLAVRNRGLVAVLAVDPSVATALQQDGDWRDLITRQLRLLADVEAGPAGEIRAAMVFAGMAGAVGPAWVKFDDRALAENLKDAGRRTLGLRAPRRPT
ncbi:TetR family transcriptional regulator [Mycobacterium sp. E136]|uniref:TetR/AcrR family transcriptional regulator n=1 Tax=Mycobacterium sp. E136 TaxID=1834125 RepID=UPI000801D4B7|nr:TetR/AcrR family transcriptional regulator [Mycobacterium sp. E136]OBG84197.1 TetR family transcriptional regulator [Mycobacterium sp. E136]